MIMTMTINPPTAPPTTGPKILNGGESVQVVLEGVLMGDSVGAMPNKSNNDNIIILR